MAWFRSVARFRGLGAPASQTKAFIVQQEHICQNYNQFWVEEDSDTPAIPAWLQKAAKEFALVLNSICRTWCHELRTAETGLYL